MNKKILVMSALLMPIMASGAAANRWRNRCYLFNATDKPITVSLEEPETYESSGGTNVYFKIVPSNKLILDTIKSGSPTKKDTERIEFGYPAEEGSSRPAFVNYHAVVDSIVLPTLTQDPGYRVFQDVRQVNCVILFEEDPTAKVGLKATKISMDQFYQIMELTTHERLGGVWKRKEKKVEAAAQAEQQEGPKKLPAPRASGAQQPQMGGPRASEPKPGAAKAWDKKLAAFWEKLKKFLSEKKADGRTAYFDQLNAKEWNETVPNFRGEAYNISPAFDEFLEELLTEYGATMHAVERTMLLNAVDLTAPYIFGTGPLSEHQIYEAKNTFGPKTSAVIVKILGKRAR